MCVVTLSLCAYKDTCCYSSAPRRWCTYNVRGTHKRSRSDGAAVKTEAPRLTGSWAPASRTSSANQRVAWWWEAAPSRSGHTGLWGVALTSSSSSVVKFFLKRCLKWSPRVFLFFFSGQRTLVMMDTSAVTAPPAHAGRTCTWYLAPQSHWRPAGAQQVLQEGGRTEGRPGSCPSLAPPAGGSASSAGSPRPELAADPLPPELRGADTAHPPHSPW